MTNFTDKIKQIQEQRRAKLDNIAKLQQELDADESNLVAILASLAENMVEIGEGVCAGTTTLLAEKEEKEQENSIENKEENSNDEGSENEDMEELFAKLQEEGVLDEDDLRTMEEIAKEIDPLDNQLRQQG